MTMTTDETYVELDTHEFTSFRFRRSLQEFEQTRQFIQGWTYILQCEAYLTQDVWLQRAALRFMVAMSWHALKTRMRLPANFTKIYTTFTLFTDEEADRKLIAQWEKVTRVHQEKKERRQLKKRIQTQESEVLRHFTHLAQSTDPHVRENLAWMLQENIRAAIFDSSPIALDRIESLLHIFWTIPTRERGRAHYALLRTILNLPRRLRREGGWQRRRQFSMTTFSDLWDLRTLRAQEYEIGATYQNASGMYCSTPAPVVHLFQLLAREALTNKNQSRQKWCRDWITVLQEDFPNDEWLTYYDFALGFALGEKNSISEKIRSLLETQSKEAWAWCLAAWVERKSGTDARMITGLFAKALLCASAFDYTKDYIPKAISYFAKHNERTLAKALLERFCAQAKAKNIPLRASIEKLRQRPWVSSTRTIDRNEILSRLQSLAQYWEAHYYADAPWFASKVLDCINKGTSKSTRLGIWATRSHQVYATDSPLFPDAKVGDCYLVQVHPHDYPLRVIAHKAYPSETPFPAFPTKLAVISRIVRERQLIRFSSARPAIYTITARAKNLRVGDMVQLWLLTNKTTKDTQTHNVYRYRPTEQTTPRLRKTITHERIESITMQGIGTTQSGARVPARLIQEHDLHIHDHVTGYAHWHYDRAHKKWLFLIDTLEKNP